MARRLLSREEVFAEIEWERAYQDAKFGADKEQSVPGFFTILENELAEAKKAWTKGGIGRQSCMHELLQIAATAVAACEKYGVQGCPEARDDGDGDSLRASRCMRTSTPIHQKSKG